MESRLLYKATKFLKSNISWENDWIHFGTPNNVNFELVEKAISEFLLDEKIHLVVGRMDSGTFERETIFTKIKPLLGEIDFDLWNESMTQVIQFNEIGILQKGKCR